jgi:hypothetical protein
VEKEDISRGRVDLRIQPLPQPESVKVKGKQKGAYEEAG